MDCVTSNSKLSAVGPWTARRTGLQKKLILSFMGVLALAMGTSCWLVISESRSALDSLVIQQTLEVSRTVSMASEIPLADNDVPELDASAGN